MTEEEAVKASIEENEANDLDLTVKKKKKKKKAFVLDDDTEKTDGDDKPKNVHFDDEEKPADDEDEDLELALTKKKKKKSKKVKVLEQEPEDVQDVPEPLDDDMDEELDLTSAKKKKKKTDQIDLLEPSDLLKESWSGTDRDYTFDELLNRVFEIMQAKNPEMVAGEKKRFIMKPPQCARVGTKKTSFVNFTEICQTLKRQPKHILAFILAELGTSGSVDGNNQLIIKGRFQQKQLESVLRRYIKEYVTCHTCRSPDTILERDVRLYFLKCRVCQSRCSVATIRSGFQAVTGKRARIRAKMA
jgi:translation initiation factor 2 subunit 2